MNEIDVDYFYHITENNLDKFYHKCSFCGKLSQTPHTLKYIERNNFLCDKHKDRTSFPERMMCSVLDYFNVIYQMHVHFKWSDGKEYDFYIPNLKIIIEIIKVNIVYNTNIRLELSRFWQLPFNILLVIIVHLEKGRILQILAKVAPTISVEKYIPLVKATN